MSAGLGPGSSSGYRVQCPPTLIPGATITFCGEAPGSREVELGQGWVGGAGQMLRRICSNVGIDFERCNRTNVAKARPAGDDFGLFYLDPKKRTEPTEELKWWTQLLIKETEAHRPNVMVAMGNEALRAFTGLTGITNYSGSILESNVIPGLKVIAAFHTAYIMRDNWEEYYVAIRHFKKVAAEAKSPNRLLEEAPDVFVIGPTFLQALAFIEWIASDNHPWYLDIETRGDTITCFGLSSDGRPGEALCVPIQTTTGPYFTIAEEAAIWRALSIAMRDNRLLRNQNIAYDLDYMLDFGCEPAGIDFDPMVAMNVAYPEFAKGLDYTTALYTYYPFYKNEGKTWKKKVPDQQVWNYNCKDMVATPKVSAAIIKDLTESKLIETYKYRSNRLFGIALEMQRNKLKLNREWHKQLATILSEEKVKKHQELIGRIGREINVKSSPQVQQLLFKDMRLPAKYKRGTDDLTTEENALKELRADFPQVPELNLILEERHLRTRESNYINAKFDIDDDGSWFLPYMVTIGGAKTGRWSMRKSPKWRGSSAQTIAKVMRLMYEPPPGSCFWQRDLSQAEVRIVAWISNCRFLLDVFESGIKIHKLVASRVYKTPLDKIEDDSWKYDRAKRVVHAYDYMMRYKKLAVTANMPTEEARILLLNYGMEVPEIDGYHRETKDIAITKGRLVTPMGRVRICYKACGAVTHTGQLPDEILRDLVSYIPQSTVPDVLNEALWELWNENPWVKWHQQGHDSFLASGAPQRTQEFFEKSQAAADKVKFYIKGRECNIPGEFQWGYLWGAMLKYRPGEDTSYDAWQERATKEGYFDEAKIREKLYAMDT